MKCLVCGKEYEAAECPRCRFPNIQIVGDQEQALKAMMPTIEQYRRDFLNAVRIGLVIYRWKDQNGQLVMDRQEQKLLGTADELRRGEKWLEDKFARIADQKQISVTLSIAMAGEEKLVQASVPNLQKAELQQLGAKVDENCNLLLMLSNETEKPTISQPIALFAV